jgi:glycosyltransferase involved in cell wall biosynthesis
VKQPKHVIVVTDYAWVIGGASKVAMMSAVALAERGYDTHHFSVVGPVAAELAASPATVHCLQQPAILEEPNRFLGAQKGLWNRDALKAFERLLEGFSPADTLVHVHQWTKALSPSIFDPMVRRGFKFVVTLHDYFISCPNGGFLVYKSTEICRLKPMTIGCIACNCDPRNYAHKLWRVCRQVIQNQVLLVSGRLKDVIYVSEFSRAILSRHLPGSLNWYFVPNPVQVARMPRVNVSANKQFVFVGRLSKEKGGHLFAAAAKLANVPAVFVGDGEQREDILRRNRDAIVTGWLSPNRVFEELARARALVFPSV